MVKLKNFLQNIALGELQSSPLVPIGSWELNPDRVPQVIHALNQGLEYFYSNFPLKTNEVLIRIYPEITRYYLDSHYGYKGNSFKQYIIDTPDRPFEDDVLHILAVCSSTGEEYNINDDYGSFSIHTPEYNCIQVNGQIPEHYLVVQYRAKHPDIPLTEPMSSEMPIHIPSSYRAALQTYVACFVLQNMGGEHLQESNALFAKFKTLTEELKQHGIGTTTTVGTNIKPMLRGWL